VRDEVYQSAAAAEDTHWWFRARREIILSLIPKLPNDISILEVGCGNGGNLKSLSTLGQLSAIEMNQDARARANSRNVAVVEYGCLPDHIDLSKQYELVLALDVLEHVEDESAGFLALSKLVKPGGILMLTVPAFNFLWSSHDEDSLHYRRYHIGDFEELVSESSMKIDYLSFFNCLLFPFALAYFKIFLRFFQERKLNAMNLPPKWINELFHIIFASEARILGRFRLPFGSSIVCRFVKDKPD
jgi:SAM-dependent methyltransferase